MIFLIEIPASPLAFACLHFVSVFWHCSCNKGAVSPACGSSYERGHAGRYYRPLTSDPINIFCVDITHDIHTSGTCTANTQYHIPDAKGSLSGSCYAGGLASAITTNDLGSVTVTSIWDIVRDGGDGLTSGRVQARNLGSLGSLVAYYEALAGHQTTDQSSTATWIQSPRSASGGHQQNLMYAKGNTTYPHAVPEPGVPTMILCMGLVAGTVVITHKRRMTIAI